MERPEINLHAFDNFKLQEEVKQKILDRVSAHQTDTRQRVDTLRTTGLGHRRILRDPEVIARVAAFIAG